MELWTLSALVSDATEVLKHKQSADYTLSQLKQTNYHPIALERARKSVEHWNEQLRLAKQMIKEHVNAGDKE